MRLLLENLPYAFERAKDMEKSAVPDNFSENIATIHKRGDFETILYVNMYKGRGNVYARLYAKRDSEMVPTTLGCKFTENDNIEMLNKFYEENTLVK